MKKILSIIIASLMLTGCMSVFAFAAENESNVYFSAFDGTIVMDKQILTVSDGTAEEYGYTVPSTDHNGKPINGITALDVLVAAHKAYYKEAFTKETAEKYLKLSYGYLSVAFGKNANATSFAINNDFPDDGIYNESYGSCTGYSYDEARMSQGDYMSLFFYQDKTYYSDDIAKFDIDEYTSNSGSAELTLTLCGYSYMWYGYLSDVSEYTETLGGVDVYVKNGDGAYSSVGKTDDKGQITISFSEQGSYSVCAYGKTVDSSDEIVPVSAAWCSVKINNPSLKQKIIDFFTKIINFIKSLFNIK